MRGKRILVTGGAGFIGANLIKKLAPSNKIISVDNYTTGKHQNEIPSTNVTYYKRDITKDVDIFFRNDFDVIFHLAAIARIQPSFDRPVDYFENNAKGTMIIANEALKKDIPVIFAGSSSHHSGKFKNPYTFSKDVSEEIMTMYRKVYGLKSTTARFYNVYGPYQITDGAYSTVIGRWMNLIEKGEPITIYGDGTKRRDFTHVDDIVDGLIAIYDKQAWGHTLEFGTGKNHSIEDVARMFDYDNIEYQEDKPGEAQVTLCTSEFERELLDWKPKGNLKEYIEKWIKERK